MIISLYKYFIKFICHANRDATESVKCNLKRILHYADSQQSLIDDRYQCNPPVHQISKNFRMSQYCYLTKGRDAPLNS